jgi:hypothetical protein
MSNVQAKPIPGIDEVVLMPILDSQHNAKNSIFLAQWRVRITETIILTVGYECAWDVHAHQLQPGCRVFLVKELV